MTNTKTQLQIIDTREVLGMDFKIYGDIETTLFIAKDVAEAKEELDGQKKATALKIKSKVKYMTFEQISNSYNISIKALKGIKKECYRTFKEIDIVRYSEVFGCLMTFRLKLNLKNNTGELIDVLKSRKNTYKDSIWSNIHYVN